MSKHTVAKTRYVSELWYYKGLKLQTWPSASLKVIGNPAIL